MLKKHRNAVYNIVIQYGFNANQFKVYQNNTVDVPSKDSKVARFINYLMNTSILEIRFQSVFKISLISNQNIWFKIYSHRTTEGFFQCAYSKYDINYGRVSYPVTEKDGGEYDPYFKFDQVQGYLEIWLKGVRHYIDTVNTGSSDYPDLWEQSKYASSFLEASIIKRDDTSTFSDLEKKQIRTAIKDFRALITSNYNPNNKQLVEIDKKLDRLSSSLERLDKFDWQGVAISTIIGIITTLTLDSEKGRQLWNLFLLALQHAHGLLPK